MELEHPIVVRPAEPDDFQRIKAFDEFDSLNLDRIRAGECQVACRNGVPAAFGIFDRSFFNRCFVAMLYVHPDHRRTGLGQSLLARFETITLDPKLWISTNIQNLPMQRLLHARDYQLAGVIHHLARLPELVYFKLIDRG